MFVLFFRESGHFERRILGEQFVLPKQKISDLDVDVCHIYFCFARRKFSKISNDPDSSAFVSRRLFVFSLPAPSMDRLSLLRHSLPSIQKSLLPPLYNTSLFNRVVSHISLFPIYRLEEVNLNHRSQTQNIISTDNDFEQPQNHNMCVSSDLHLRTGRSTIPTAFRP